MRISDWSSDVCSSDHRGVHFPCASRIAPQRQSGRIRFALKLLAAIGRGFEVDLDRGVKAEVVDAAFVGLGHLDAPAARVEQDLADPGHMAGEHRGETADGVDILLDLGEPRVDDLADIVEFGARVGFPAARSEEHTSELQSIMRNSY